MTADGRMDSGADVVAILTGNVLKDSDYSYQYHTGLLKSPDGQLIISNLGNKPVIVPYDLEAIASVLGG